MCLASEVELTLLTGKVVSGMGNFSYWIEKLHDHYLRKTGMNLFPGTLNVLLDEAKIYQVEAAHLRFPIGDFGLPTAYQMNSILDSIDQNLENGRKIYLHCWGGIGRTGTTVGCYLVRRGKTGEEALDQLSTWWRGVPKSRYHIHSPETFEQMEFIRTWAKQDRNLLSSGS